MPCIVHEQQEATQAGDPKNLKISHKLLSKKKQEEALDIKSVTEATFNLSVPC